MVHLKVSKMWGQEEEMAWDVLQAMCPVNPELSVPWQEWTRTEFNALSAITAVIS